jgi:hypothetical protein
LVPGRTSRDRAPRVLGRTIPVSVRRGRVDSHQYKLLDPWSERTFTPWMTNEALNLLVEASIKRRDCLMFIRTKLLIC